VFRHEPVGRLQLYVDAAASFWREWIVNYDVSHQRSLGKTAATNTANSLKECGSGWDGSIAPFCDRPGACTGTYRLSYAWLGGAIAFAASIHHTAEFATLA